MIYKNTQKKKLQNKDFAENFDKGYEEFKINELKDFDISEYLDNKEIRDEYLAQVLKDGDKENFEITLKDARENLDEIALVCGNLNINDGFIVLYKNDCFQGAKALAFLNSAIDKTTLLGKLHFFFCYDNLFSNFLYKFLFILRKIILFILGVNSKIQSEFSILKYSFLLISTAPKLAKWSL